MDRPTSSDTMPKKDHERDLELDKKIEALRRKNEALMKRYKEVEEDKKRAEEEGMALQSRKGKAEDLTITISKSTSESRVVVTKPFRGQQEAGPDGSNGPGAGPSQGAGPPLGAGRGHRKQLTVTMAGRKGKRLVSERPDERPGPPAEVKSPTDDGQARRVEAGGKGRQHPHPTSRDTDPQEGESTTDLNIPTSREEQEEYLRWKKEREQIDRERVARHKNAKGQWRRAWDVDKTENMFSDKSLPDRDWGSSSRGRHAKRGQGRAGPDSRGHEKRSKDKGSKNVLVMSSKAKGKDRLTGRARRWQANEEGGSLQTSDTTLEEFLEELDALTDTEPEDQRDQDTKAKLSSGPDSTCEEGSDDPAPGKPEASSPRGSEKKVRFSEELIQVAHLRRPTGSQDSEPRNPSSIKASSPKKYKHDSEKPQQPEEGSDQDQGGAPSDPPVAEQQACDTGCTEEDTPTAPSRPPAVNGSASEQPVELVKCSISSTHAEELIDSGLSVLSLESGETHPTHSTSSDKAREHGKIV